MKRGAPAWLWVCFLVAFLSSLVWHSQRLRQEQAHRSVELVLDYNSLVDLARSQGKEWSALLPEFTRHGVSALGFSELRLDELEGYGLASVFSGVALGAELGSSDGGVDPQHTYLVCWPGGKALLSPAQLLQAVSDAFPGKVSALNASHPRLQGATVIDIALPLRSVANVGICFPSWGIEQARAAGLKIWLRPENKPPINSEAVRAYLTRLQAYKPEGIIFGGSSNEAVGYSDVETLKTTAATVRELNWKLGFIELPKATQQKGIETLVRQLPERTVRVFAVPQAQQATLKPDRVAQMYGLAARERNLTVLYLRPYAYDPSPDKGFEDGNERLFSSIKADLGDRLGPAATFEQHVQLGPVGAALVSLGGLAAAWLIAGRFVTLPVALVAGSLVMFAALNAIMVLSPVAHIWLALMALGSACCSAALAVISQFEALRLASQGQSFTTVMGRSTVAWLKMSCISLMGAFIASCFLQDTTYKLGLDIFRGVKVLTVLVPLAITVVWALSEGEREHWLHIGVAPLKLYQLVALGVLAVGGIFYTMRTGNMAGDVGGDALEMEKWLRMVLDQTLGVRPRFKEFLLAHPAMLLAPLMLRWGWREATAVFVLVGSLGQVGLLDTFAHVHTPLMISLIRCLMGIALGALLGWIYAGVLWLASEAVKRRSSNSTCSVP